METVDTAHVKLRAYESTVSSILSKCEVLLEQRDDPVFPLPLPHFPPRFRPLPDFPDDERLSRIQSGAPERFSASRAWIDPPTPTTAPSGSKKKQSRLMRRRAERKRRAEAEDGPPSPPCWPFDVLPPPACPRHGGRLVGRRAKKKEGQLSSMIRCVLSMLPDEALGPVVDSNDEESSLLPSAGKRIRIVDFAGGSGHLALPLALLLPRCDVVLVDLKESSLELAGRRRAECGRRGDAIPNLSTHLGSIAGYSEPFDIGLALHACGEATDLALEACGKAGAAFVAAPCCVGKLSTATFDPYVYHSSGENAPTVDYPQSEFYRLSLGVSSAEFNALAKAADHADSAQDVSGIRRTAKVFVEADRLASCVERYGYDGDRVAMTRMEPRDASPKNDILLGWGIGRNGALRCPYGGVAEIYQEDACVEAKRKLLRRGGKTLEGIDWTAEEEDEVWDRLTDFFRDESEEAAVFTFPTGEGARRRRLIHFVAGNMGLVHWSHGDRDAEKTVSVARRRPPQLLANSS